MSKTRPHDFTKTHVFYSAMAVVILYRLRGRYSGPSEYQWHHPAPGAIHDCLLFLRQETAQEQYSEAELESRRHGIVHVEFFACGKLDVEVLNTDLYRGFSVFYEEAMREGCALVFYPSR
jgi:hypothetical protein